MLRLGAGLTAEGLARECARVGADTLDRGTIAKIESDNRQIKPGEVAGVARVFSLTSTDLLNAAGPVVFLSHARQDGDIGREVSGWLAGRGFRVPSVERAEAADQVGPGLQATIDAAHAFVALLSPGFLESPASLAELELAARRHQRSQPASYVHVLQVADTTELDTSAFVDYHTIDLVRATGRKREEALSRLGSKILRASAGADNPATARSSGDGWQGFIDRKDELDRVYNGLNSTAGPHFWLVMGPPGLGKTEFLRRLEARVREQAGQQWITKTVDLRDEVGDFAGDAMALVGKLFGVKLSGDPDDDRRAVAKEIIRAGRSHLYLLDSTELLQPGTVAALRRHLSQIHRLVQDRGDPNVGVTLVAASRRDEGWLGVTPPPRLSIVPFAEFDTAAVQEAVSDLVSRMSLQKSQTELRDEAALVHRATEGVPALVRRVLEWIEAEEGLEIERLNDSAVVDNMVRPFIRDELLAPDSLLPGDTSQFDTSGKCLWIMEQAIKWLVPYRFFTLAHVRALSGTGSFEPAMNEARWSDNDLWQAIGACALLVRPQAEPWREIHPALRRLLFRDFYTKEDRADAHRRAREFTEQWAAKQNGREQAIGLIDCIWHEAASLRLTSAAEMEGILTNYIRERANLISESDAYTENELRVYAAERLRSDDELRAEVAGVDGLFDRLVHIVGTGA